MKKIKENKRGFTLVEIIIYLAIFTMVSVLIINSLITVMSSFSRTKSNRSLIESSINSMGRISREVRGASNIDIADSNLASGLLYLDIYDSLGVKSTVEFATEGGALNMYTDGVLSGNLLDPNIYLDSLVFTRISTTQSEALKIEMIIHDTNSKTVKNINFYDTVILRGGYK